MTTLEKILQEIEKIEKISFSSYTEPLIALSDVKNMIKRHLSENKCGNCSRRKFYMLGYQDNTKQNDWIPCSVRMPDKPDEYYGEEGYIVQTDDIIEPFSAYWDGEKFTDSEDRVVYDVIAWCNLPKPYKPDQESSDAKRQRNTEEFFTEYQEGK